MTARKIRNSLTQAPDSLIKKQALHHASFLLQENNQRQLRKNRIAQGIENTLDPIDTPFEVEMFTAGKTPIDTPIEMQRYLKDALTRFGQSSNKNKDYDENEEQFSYSKPKQ